MQRTVRGGIENTIVSYLVLFRLSPNPSVSIVVDFDVNPVGSAADWAVLDVFLAGTLRQVERHYDPQASHM